MTTLASSVGASLPPDDGLRFGVIESINPLLVNVTGGLIPAGIQGSYVPALGDSVSMIRQDGTWLITGRVGAPEMLYPTSVDVVGDGVVQTGVTSASYVNMTGLTNIGFSKASDASTVQLDLIMSAVAAGTGSNVRVGVRILFVPASGAGAGAGFSPVASHWFNQLTLHLAFGCHKRLRGIAAGDYLVSFQWAGLTIAGGQSFGRDANDTFSAILEER